MEIRYPTEKWLSAYQRKHDCTREKAEQVWWDNEIDHDRPTPFDLTDEQAKVEKEMRKGAKAVDAYGKTTQRVRKPNEDKRWAVQRIALLFEGFAGIGEIADVVTDNPERAISYTRNGKRYTLTLTEHRSPKA